MKKNFLRKVLSCVLAGAMTVSMSGAAAMVSVSAASGTAGPSEIFASQIKGGTHVYLGKTGDGSKILWSVNGTGNNTLNLVQTVPTIYGTASDKWSESLLGGFVWTEETALLDTSVAASEDNNVTVNGAASGTELALKDTEVSKQKLYLLSNKEAESVTDEDDYYSKEEYWTRNAVAVKTLASGDTTDYSAYAATATSQDANLNSAEDGTKKLGFRAQTNLDTSSRKHILLALTENGSSPAPVYTFVMIGQDDEGITKPVVNNVYTVQIGTSKDMILSVGAYESQYHLAYLETDRAYTDSAANVVSYGTAYASDGRVSFPIANENDKFYIMLEANYTDAMATHIVSDPVEVKLSQSANETISWARLGGEDRYATAAAIAKKAFAGVNPTDVVLVSGDSFADSIVASAFAGGIDAPVLITEKDQLSEATAELIGTWNPQRAFIIGGTGAVSDVVADTLTNEYKVRTVERIKGDDRYGTSENVYTRGKTAGGSDTSLWGNAAVITTGEKAADALSISPWTYSKVMPVLLADADGNLSSSMMAIAKTFKQIYILGGTGVVSTDTESSLRAVSGITVSRLGGEDRYQTSVAIAVAFTSIENGSDLNHTVYASGADGHFADALVGGMLAGRQNQNAETLQYKAAPILLIDGTSGAGFDFTRYNYTNPDYGISMLYFLGGTSALTDTTKAAVLNNWTENVEVK